MYSGIVFSPHKRDSRSDQYLRLSSKPGELRQLAFSEPVRAPLLHRFRIRSRVASIGHLKKDGGQIRRSMRRILILLAIFAVLSAAFAALWIFRGREISYFLDRYWTVETGAAAIRSIGYEGSGTGGILIVNGVSLSLNDVRPGLSLSIGSTKDNQLALASSGKVFAFGPLASVSEDTGVH